MAADLTTTETAAAAVADPANLAVDAASDPAAWIAANWSLDLTLAEWWHRLFDAGLAFPTWPVGLGGTGASPAEARRIAAALDAAGVIAPPAGNGPNMGAPTVIEHGTDEQRQRFVAPVASGLEQWCQLFSEPGAGSDLACLSTRAVLDGDHYVVTGQKVWSSKADVSEWGMLLCRTDVDRPKHDGITFLMLDMRQPGVEVRPLRQMNGASEFSEVFLTDVRVPVDNVIGPVGGGWRVARTTLAHERASSAGGAAGGGGGRGGLRGAAVVEAGTIAGNLDRTTGELLGAWRHAGGAPRRQPPLLGARAIAELARERGLDRDPVLRDRIARYHVHSRVHRWTSQRARDLARSKVPTHVDGSLLKLDLAMLAHESRDLSLDILGAAAMVAWPSAPDGGRVLTTGLSAFVPSLGGGTNEIQRNIIGERSLGLPREPSTDADVPFRELRRC